MVDYNSILTPALALISWSVVVLIWLYIERLPPTIKQNIKFDSKMTKEKYHSLLPVSANAVADNYNHLMEQPTIFYALIFYLHATKIDSALQVYLAWAYVITRIIHTFVQARLRIVPVRFLVFMVSSVVLISMVVLAWLS